MGAQAATLRTRVAALEAENARLLDGWEKEKRERAEENAAAAKAAAEAAASIADLQHRIEEYTRDNNKLNARVLPCLCSGAPPPFHRFPALIPPLHPPSILRSFSLRTCLHACLRAQTD